MNLYLVSGFLGSGKTTAIVEAAKLLIANNKRVGIVTNDQGKYLVDTAFVRAEGIPTVEVTGGCFCCHYDDLEKVLCELNENLSPDLIFAESVGSCADIISSVMNPLLKLRPIKSVRSILTVFTDIRFLQARSRGEPLPFSDEVIYIFDQQIEEAEILILNKKDCLNDVEGQVLLNNMKKKYPQKTILLQNSFLKGDVINWLESLSVHESAATRKGLNLDYEKYADGEAKLVWMDAKMVLRSQNFICWKPYLENFFQDLVKNIQRDTTVAHLKYELVLGDLHQKISVTSFQEKWIDPNIKAFQGNQVSVLLNIRAESEPGMLRNHFQRAVKEVEISAGITVELEFENAFTPPKPNPAHHIP